MARAVRGTRNGKLMAAPVDAIDAATQDAVVLAAPPPLAAEAAPPPVRALHGYIDRATWTGIDGWVWDPETPEARIRLELVEGDVALAGGVADQDRPGLAGAGIGDGRHAFAIDLEPGLLSDGPHVLHLRCAETGAAMPGSPVTIEPLAGTPAAAFRWHLDEITDTEASGWIVARNEPSRHRVVVLKEDERVLARAVASRYREDLLTAGIGDGCYAFSLEMPRALLDGEEHLLEIVEEESGVALTGEKRRWRSAAGTAGPALTGIGAELERPPPAPRAEAEILRPFALPARRPAAGGAAGFPAAAQAGTHLLVDVSDLVYYIAAPRQSHRHPAGAVEHRARHDRRQRDRARRGDLPQLQCAHAQLGGDPDRLPAQPAARPVPARAAAAGRLPRRGSALRPAAGRPAVRRQPACSTTAIPRCCACSAPPGCIRTTSIACWR